MTDPSVDRYKTSDVATADRDQYFYTGRAEVMDAKHGFVQRFRNLSMRRRTLSILFLKMNFPSPSPFTRKIFFIFGAVVFLSGILV